VGDLGAEGARVNTARCRSCNAEIVWASTAQGKFMPVDAESVPDGNVELTPTFLP
jgi:hypothetical protein